MQFTTAFTAIIMVLFAHIVTALPQRIGMPPDFAADPPAAITDSEGLTDDIKIPGTVY
jgi:hypothetical protein